MNAKQFDALVNKGAVTHVGVVADIERLSTDDFCAHHITHHEIASELVENKIDTVDEIIAALTCGGPIKVEGDINLNPATTVLISKDTELNLNDKTISGEVGSSSNNGGEMFYIDGCRVMIKNGSIADNLEWDGKSTPAGAVLITNGAEVEFDSVNVKGIYPVWIKGDGAVVTIKSGDFRSTVSQTIYIQGQSKVIIEGGNFEAPMFGTRNYCLNIKDSEYDKTKPATDYFEVRGGRFVNFNPAMNDAENPTTSFVAAGYESVEVEPNVFEVRRAEIPAVEPEPIVEETPVEETAPVAEETPAPAAKKSKKAKNVAPSVDPVE